MRLALSLGYSGSRMSVDMDLVKEAEAVGFDSVWTAEAYGSDAVSPLAWIGAQTTKIRLGTGILQLPARSPAMTAMTAMTLDQLSNGRFLLGLGTSGPQVVEGWHGVPFSKPLTWLREYITIVRKILSREAPLEFQGERYRIPYDGQDATGLGKPLKSILHGRASLPIYTGSMAPLSQALAAELCDGVIVTCFIPERFDVVQPNFEKGFARVAGGKTFADFDVMATVGCIIGDDLDACRLPLRMQTALYVGGMGARDKNFYNEYVSKAGFEAEAKKIQDLYLEGKRNEAIMAVTDQMVDAMHLVGPPERIRDEYQKWKESKVSTLLVGTAQKEALRLLAELAG